MTWGIFFGSEWHVVQQVHVCYKYTQHLGGQLSTQMA